ncbi:MAG: alpha/beta hydrolase [Gemmatimonadota bacterium]|nr:MAG: alpha/beta hydrolase [Gemmatimonadota bacterium]
MFRRGEVVLPTCALLLLSGAVSLGAQEVWLQGRVELTPCQLPLYEGEAWCGAYEVWEDRDAQAGRRITLRIGVQRAESPDPLPDPVFIFNGGPGGAAVELAAYVAECRAVLGGRAEGPAHFVNTDSRLGDPDMIAVTRDQIGATLRFMLVSQGGASQIPAFVHAAYQDDFGPLGERALLQRRLGPTAFSRGLFFSVICAEEVTRLSEEELSEMSEGTFWGESWVRGIVDDCSGWPIGELPPGYFEPVAGLTPVLIQHGWLDPVTPPAWAEELTRHLPNARVMVIREGHHNFGYEECGKRHMAECIDNLDSSSLDESCTAEMKRPPFLVPER